MPFDPRLIPPEPPPLDAQGEIDLPDDLAMLAEQLGDDARHLAQCYPAECYPAACEKKVAFPPRINKPREHRGRQLALILGSGLACSLVAFALIVVTIDMFAVRSWRSASVASESAMPAMEDNIDRRVAFSLEPVENVADPQWTPVMLRNVSQPELEGLIDLWQDQSPEVATISF